MGIVETWLDSLLPNTRRNYGEHFRRLLGEAGLSGEQALEAVRKEGNTFDTYSKLVLTAKKHKPSVQRIMIFSLRRFLYDLGVTILPPARVRKSAKARKDSPLTWDQALSICSATAKPYGQILKLMLNCGWGVSEFLKFNTAENWENVKQHLLKTPLPEYYRFDFQGRKRNTENWFSLVPTWLLQEVTGSLQVPIRANHGNGVILDRSHYVAGRNYLESAFKTGCRRSSVVFLNGSLPWPHELRDTFRTRAVKVGCSDSVAEFVMGHTVDHLGYIKINSDEKFVWSELKKVYGPQLVTENELQSRDQRIAELEQQVAVMTQNFAEVRRLHLGGIGDLDISDEAGLKRGVEQLLRYYRQQLPTQAPKKQKQKHKQPSKKK